MKPKPVAGWPRPWSPHRLSQRPQALTEENPKAGPPAPCHQSARPALGKRLSKRVRVASVQACSPQPPRGAVTGGWSAHGVEMLASARRWPQVDIR